MAERVEMLRAILKGDPANRLARYGLAMEYAKADRLDDAVAEYRALIASHPDYAYAYYHGGQTLERLGLGVAARAMYEEGVKAAERSGDSHARNEIQAALDLLA
jgi:tetratricopeptide (TPR) repeat protein